MPDSTAATSPPRPTPSTYWRATRTATYGFLSALPLLVLYEVMIVLANHGQAAQVRIGAEVWIKQWFTMLGVPGLHVLAGIVVLIGIAIFWVERKKQIPLRGGYFVGIVAESTMYAVVLAVLVSQVVGAIFAMFPSPQAEPLGMRLALSIGAGLYEELVFRVLLVGGLYWALSLLFERAVTAYLIAAVVGAAVFSAVHYLGPLGDAFALPSFTFRFLFGLALNAVFLVRGFGAAAWTHALYDVMVVTRVLG